MRQYKPTWQRTLETNIENVKRKYYESQYKDVERVQSERDRLVKELLELQKQEEQVERETVAVKQHRNKKAMELDKLLQEQ